SPEVIARRGRAWNQDPHDVPWLDREDASARIQARLAQGLVTADEAELLRQWDVEGYFILPGAVDGADTATLDQATRDLAGPGPADRPIDGLQVMSLHIKGRPSGPIDHAEILSWPLDVRLQLRDSQLWRVHYWHCHSKAAMALSTAPRLIHMASLILEEPATLVSYIQFKRGSEVGVHQDLAAMHIPPT